MVIHVYRKFTFAYLNQITSSKIPQSHALKILYFIVIDDIQEYFYKYQNFNMIILFKYETVRKYGVGIPRFPNDTWIFITRKIQGFCMIFQTLIPAWTRKNFVRHINSMTLIDLLSLIWIYMNPRLRITKQK